MYNKADLNNELDEIIRRYNIVPWQIKNDRYKTTQITYNPNQTAPIYEDKKGKCSEKKKKKVKIDNSKSVYLMIDPNDTTKGLNYKIIKNYCDKFDIEFKNQTFTAMIKELRKIWINKKSVRGKMTIEKRNQVIKKCNNKCNICKKECIFYEIDHIKPLASGGEDKLSNLQSLCKKCHFGKTKQEKDNNEYVKLSDTESTFNTDVKSVMYSGLANNHAFIERITDDIPDMYKDNKIYFFDLNKCRTNNLLYNKEYELPVFTVMDSVKPFDINVDDIDCGLYFVESKNYFPLRCNGWYYEPLIDYCLAQKIISPEDIKYKIKASLSVPANYFDEFIKFCKDNLDDYAKIAVNSIIGNFKPAKREYWQSKVITQSPSEAYYHYLSDKSAIIDIRNINNHDEPTEENPESFLTSMIAEIIDECIQGPQQLLIKD